jgi:hypothetical protein
MNHQFKVLPRNTAQSNHSPLPRDRLTEQHLFRDAAASTNSPQVANWS